MTHIDQFLVQYGYFAVFGLLMLGIVGPLIPDETILVLTGIFIHRGQLHFLPAAAAGVAGSMCGISVSFAIGLYGFGWLESHWPVAHQFADRHMAKAEQWFERFGKWTLFFGYFVAGVRHFTALFAGITCLPFREFAVFAYSGAICWVLTFISIGYFAGSEWACVGGTVDRIIVVAALAITLGGLLWWKARRR